MPTVLIDLLTRAARSSEAVLAQLDPEDRERPTPCPEMTVVQVAAHLIGGLRGFTEVADGGELRFDAALEPVLDRERVDVVFRGAVDALIAAFGPPGRLDATYAMP